MRYAMVDPESGMVIGDGATEQEAREDAAREARMAGVSVGGATVRTYDPATHEVRLHGGVVQIMQRDDAALEECTYCAADVPARTDVPAASDDATWTAIASEHASGCEWVATRAHRV